MLHSARLVVLRSNLSANEKSPMSEGCGLKSRPTNRKLLDLSCLLIDLKDHGVAVMSIVIELLVLLEKKMFIV